MPFPAAGQLMKGYAIVSITDGTSNTGLFSEKMRSTQAYNTTGTLDHAAVVRTSTFTAAQLLDGRTAPGCTATAPTTGLRYTGHQYYRALPFLNDVQRTRCRPTGTARPRRNCSTTAATRAT